MRLWILANHAAIIIMIFPLGLTLFDLWILARNWIAGKRRAVQTGAAPRESGS